MAVASGHRQAGLVALLAEGVDRNSIAFTALCRSFVALLAEGVDRNRNLLHNRLRLNGRPPRGGRG